MTKIDELSKAGDSQIYEVLELLVADEYCLSEAIKFKRVKKHPDIIEYCIERLRKTYLLRKLIILNAQRMFFQLDENGLCRQQIAEKAETNGAWCVQYRLHRYKKAVEVSKYA